MMYIPMSAKFTHPRQKNRRHFSGLMSVDFTRFNYEVMLEIILRLHLITEGGRVGEWVSRQLGKWKRSIVDEHANT